MASSVKAQPLCCWSAKTSRPAQHPWPWYGCCFARASCASKRDPAMSPERFFILACESVHPFWGHWPQNVLGCGRNMAYRTAFGLVCIPELECRLRPCVEVMLVLYVCNYVCMYVCIFFLKLVLLLPNVVVVLTGLIRSHQPSPADIVVHRERRALKQVFFFSLFLVYWSS